MSRCSSLIVLFCVAALIVETFAAPDEPILLRSKRQQCRCVKNPNGGLTCSCAKGPANAATAMSAAASSTMGSSNTYTAQQDTPTDIANQLTAMQQQTPGHAQARCGCIQIVFQGTPQYNCQCGDQNGNPLPTSTTMAPTTSTTTLPPTTTSTTTTSTTTTPAPVSYPQVPTQTQGPAGNGACNCIMISITSPQTAQYQCQCANAQQQPVQTSSSYESSQYEYPPQTEIPGTLPPPSSQTSTTTSTTTITPITTPSPVLISAPAQTMVTAAPPAVYQAVGTLATPQEACYCVDPVSNTMSQYCGCSCNCLTMMVSTPNAYCGCPQQAQAYPAETYDYTQVYQTQPTTTTVAPTPAPIEYTTPATTTTTTTQAAPLADSPSATQYPLTTTCVMYVNVPLTACSCLPQYDQCAQNVCCLKSKFRSYNKKTEESPSTIDMLMNVLQTIKTKLE